MRFNGSTLHRGFTLIELMIVVAIIGILAAVALPAYQTYTVKSKMTEVILAASQCRSVISEVYQTANSAPGAGNWGCEISTGSRYVSNVTTDVNGLVMVTVSSDTTLPVGVSGAKLTLAPYSTQSVKMASSLVASNTPIFKWVCGSSADGTSIPTQYLPGSCRG